MVDSGDMGGVVFSVRRVSDYLSSHIDLNDYTRKDATPAVSYIIFGHFRANLCLFSR